MKPTNSSELPALATADLDEVTGGGLRSWTYGALTALSIGTGNPAGEKMWQPNLNPAGITQTIGGR